MPWCRIDKTYKMDCIEIHPFERNKPDAEQNQINRIMAVYKTIEGKPVEKAAIVSYNSKFLADDLSEDDIDTIHEFVSIACFCGLSNREYFYPLPKCNSDCFILYIHRFNNNFNKGIDHMGIRTRQREGVNWNDWPIDDIAITIPTNCHSIQNIILDNPLLDALIAYRLAPKNDNWTNWINAIFCFNQANTDSDNFLYQVEFVLMCSAFEKLLGAESDYRDVADKFSKTIMPNNPLQACDANRRLDKSKQPLRYEWMKEFYRIRGDFAHGKLKTGQPHIWTEKEHLLLASIAFPLAFKSLLKNDGLYELTIEDQTQIDAFERLADTKDFLIPPSDCNGALVSHWKRLCDDIKSSIEFKKAFDKACRDVS